MSDSVLSTLMICATIICLFGINAWVKTRMQEPRVEIREAPPERHVPLKERISTFDPDPGETEGVPEWPDPDPPVNNDPLPYDSANPPREVIYRPRPNSPYAPPNCHCHGRPLRNGQRVLLWPVPNSEEKKIVCQREEA